MKRAVWGALASMTLMTVSGFAQEAPANGQVYEKHQENQQKRIENGVDSGKLSNHQAKRLEKNQTKINHEVERDQAKNGGTLTPGEKAKVSGQMHKESKDIARKKNVDPKGPAEQ